MNYDNLKTDEERFCVLTKIPYWDWHIVAEWEDEAKDPKYKRIFHDASRSMYHTEEYHAYGEI